jgi:hypothetical protein
MDGASVTNGANGAGQSGDADRHSPKQDVGATTSSNTPLAERQDNGRKLIRINGVRANPGGPVRFQELRDGWATFTDFGATGRRWQRIMAVSLVVLFGALVFDEKVIGSNYSQVYLIVAIVVLVFLLWATQLVSDEKSFFSGLRLRRESARRAGGTKMLQRAINTHGRARTTGEMNILLSSLGRTDPVFSLKRVRHARVRTTWWRTTVELELANGKGLTYRVVGIRAPRKLAAAFAADRVPT